MRTEKPFMKRTLLLSVLTIFLLALVACGADQAATDEAPATTEPTEEAATAEPTTEEAETAEATTEPTEAPTEEYPEGALISIPVDEAPTLDGAADEAFWADAPSVEIEVSGGGNESDTTVSIRSVYSGDSVYFVVAWEDPTQSFIRSPWQKQEDGTWVKLSDPEDEGGDNSLYYEDKMAFIWNIANSIQGFEDQGCFTACHAGEEDGDKPFGNKYTSDEGELGDIWHWKSVRNVGQMDDQYLDWTRWSEDTPEAGRHSDPKDSGGYADNVNEGGDGPAFMAPEGGSRDGAPGFILDSEKVPFDDSLFEAGDMVPSIVVAPITGDRGNISAGWVWADGVWTLEFGRALTTGSEFDVQFDDLSAIYYFGVAVFDNVQVRHAFQTGANPFVFRAQD